MSTANLVWPLRVPPELRLLPDEPGTFGFVRPNDVHTGIDLYCNLGTEVVAIEDGVVVGIEAFTGASVPQPDASPWWNDTMGVLVRGSASGEIIVYGEVGPSCVEHVRVGQHVRQGQLVGIIDVPVLRSFKGRPMIMCHFERYSGLPAGYTGEFGGWSSSCISATAWWKIGDPTPPRLLDPTPLLAPLASGGRFDLRRYDGTFSVDPSAPRKASKWWAHWCSEAETGKRLASEVQ